MCPVVQIGDKVTTAASKQIGADHHHCQTGRTQVLLGSAVDEVEAVPVDRAAQEVGAHVCNQRQAHLGEVRKANSADRLVAGQVHEHGTIADLDLVGTGHAAEVALGTAPRLVDVGNQTGLGQCLSSPRPGVHITGRVARGQEVHGNQPELEAGTALKEQDGEIVRHRGQFPEVCQRTHVHGVVCVCTVAGLNYRHAGATEVEQFVANLFEDANREGAGSCTEVVDPGGGGHGLLPCSSQVRPRRDPGSWSLTQQG